MRQIPVKIWLPIILAAAIAVSLAIYFTFPREEKTPEVSILEKTPTAEEEITPPEGIVWNVPEGQVDPKVVKEIKNAVFNFYKDVEVEPIRWEAWGEREKIVNSYISIEDLKIEDNWAMANTLLKTEEPLQWYPPDSGIPPSDTPPQEGKGILLRKVGEKWEVAKFTGLWSGDEKFCEWILEVPESLFPEDVKESYHRGCVGEPVP